MRTYRRKIKVTRSIFASLLIGLACAAFATSPIEPVVANAASYDDVPLSYWAYSDIEAARESGLMNGIGNDLFAPDAQLTIAEMATIVANANGKANAVAIETTDAPWYTRAMEYIQSIGLIEQDADIDKLAAEPCSKEVAVRMMVDGIGVRTANKENAVTIEDELPPLGSVDDINHDAVTTAYEYGIITGADATHSFNPERFVSRAEICAILNRAGYTTSDE